MSAPQDLLSYNRASVSNAYRKLADQALAAAELYDSAATRSEEARILERVLGRVHGVKHAMKVVAATREGLAKARGNAA